MLINFILFFTTHSIILVCSLFAIKGLCFSFFRFERTIEYFAVVSVCFVVIRLYFKLYNILMFVSSL